MAARFWIGGGTTTNWNASPTTNWCATSGGAVRVAAPTNADDVTFDGAGGGNSASVVSSTASGVCLSLTFTAGYTNTITINTGVTLTVSGNFTDNTAHTWTVSGTALLAINAASTITSGGKTFPGPVQFLVTSTKTLSGDWTISGLLTNTNTQTINSGNLTIGGGITNSSGVCNGTTVLILTGGTLQGTQAIQNSLSFAGTVTVSTFVYNTGTITYTSGTITVSGTVTVASSTTWNTAGISWNNITFSSTGTQTINSLLTVAATLQIANGAAVTFAGTSGFTCNTLNAVHTVASTQTFKNGVTYTITASFQSYLAPNSGGNTFTSDDGTLKAIITLNQGAICNTNGRFTRIDASNGRAIWTFNGTVTTCFNIFSLTDLSFVTGKSQVIQGFSNY